jgi:hypothetical protein
MKMPTGILIVNMKLRYDTKYRLFAGVEVGVGVQ